MTDALARGAGTWRGGRAVRVGRSGDGPASRRRQRGAGVVEALEPSTGVSGARRPCGPVDRPTAKDGGETGKAVCGPRPGTPVDAELDLDVIWRLGSLPAVRQRIP